MIKDPFGSMQGFFGKLQGFMQNPMQFLMQNKLNLPANINPMQNPDAAIQYLLNNGTMPQDVYNKLQQMSRKMQDNPQFQQQLQQFQQQMMNSGQNQR